MALEGVTILKFTFGLAAAMAIASASSALASGDAAAGERIFNQCVACHVVQNEAGETLAGRNGRTGPNLYGTGGWTCRCRGRFRYSSSLAAYGEAGNVWSAETFTAYVMDPTGYLREALGDNGARSAMAFRVRSADDALNLYAYLEQLAAQ